MIASINSWDAFNYHWFVWKLTGFQSLPRDSRWYYPFNLYVIVITFLVPVYFSFSHAFEMFFFKNLSHFCEMSYMVITIFALNIKILKLYLARKQLLEARPLLRYLDTRAQTAEELKVLQAGINNTRRWFLIFLRLYLVGYVVRLSVFTFMDKPTLPQHSWFPFDHKASRRNFWYAYAYQAVGLFVQIVQAVSVDTYPQAYLQMLCAHVETMALRIQRIGAEATENNSTQSSGLTEQQHEKNYAELVSCIKDHLNIVELFATIQRPISGTCFVQFICTGLAQCTMGFYLLQLGFELSAILSAIPFFTAVTMQTFVLCFFADRFCQKCEKVSEAIFSCNWTPQSEKFRKSLLLFLIRSQQISMIMAGNVIPVQLPTFVQVIKTAYSIFTLLTNFR